MENSSRRYFYKLKKKFKQFPKIALLSGVLLLLVFGNVSNVFAEYEDYLNLFSGNSNSGSSVPLQLQPIMKLTPASNQTLINLQFQFSGQFNITTQRDKDWYWDHIKTDNQDKAFLLRVCNKNSTSDQDCYFSSVPYLTRMYEDQKTFCKNLKCEIPDLTKDPVPKIYKWSAGIVTTSSGGASYQELKDSDIKFNVVNTLFPITQLYKLQDGQLTSPTNLDQIFKVGSGDTFQSDIWYCGAKNGSDPYPPNNQNDNSVRNFGGLCGDNLSYFKIVASNDFSMPQSLTQETTIGQQTNNINSTPVDAEADNLPACSWTGGLFGSGTLMGCASRLIYYVIYWPIAWFAGLMGNLFDFFLGYSLADASYRANFAVKGWQLVRDISNIFFILILVWTGLATIFDFGGKSSVSMKRVVPNLILSALLINFSLFVTRVVIDISNITARIFYNQIHVCQGDCRDDNGDGVYDNPLNGPGGFTSVSSKIVAQFNPQKMFSPDVLNDQASAQGVRGTNIGGSDSDTRKAGYFIIVTLIAAAIIFGIAMMFWKTAFFFLGRVIGLYMAMIFAPFAFISMGNMPIVSKIKDLSWSSWIKDLTNYALLAPIFVFFLYLISSLMNSSFLTVYDGQQSTSFFETVIYISIPMLIVYFMVAQGVKMAKSYAGKIGNMIQDNAQKAIGFVSGAAMGGTALLGGRVLGGAASTLNKSSVGLRLRDAAAKNKGLSAFLARQSLKGLKSASEGSYDIRQTGLGKNLFKEMDIKTDSKHLDVLKNAGLGLSVAQRKGGRDADIKRRVERKIETEKLFQEKMSDKDINFEEYNKRQKARYDQKIAKIIDEQIARNNGMSAADIEKMKMTNKSAYDNEAEKVKKDPKIAKRVSEVYEPKEVATANEITAARREKYIKSLQAPGVMGKGLKWLKENNMGAIATAIDSTIGAAIGHQVTEEGNKLAVKKLEEMSKASKNLSDIRNTLQKGFQDLIALQNYQSSPSFKNLTSKQQKDIVNHGKIEFDPNNPNDPLSGKSLYDILGDAERNSIDNKIKAMKADKSKAGEAALKEYQTMVQTIESSRYDMKPINEAIKKSRQQMLNKMKDPKASLADKQKATKDFLDHIREKEKAIEHQKKWTDISKYQKEQEEKLKDKKEEGSKKP